jgi:hypothetical protein
MTDGLPPAYLAYRGLWSLLHGALLVLGAVLLALWWFDGSNGAGLVADWWTWASRVQSAVFRSVSFPWD